MRQNSWADGEAQKRLLNSCRFLPSSVFGRSDHDVLRATFKADIHKILWDHDGTGKVIKTSVNAVVVICKPI